MLGSLILYSAFRMANTTSSDIEKYFHDIEFENEQLVKEIEKQKQLLKCHEDDIETIKYNTETEQSQSVKLDEDIKSLHKQFTCNRDNIKSLKDTIDVLNKHEAALQPKLDMIRKKNEQECQERENLITHYQNIWTNYKQTYDSMPLALEQREIEHVVLELSVANQNIQEEIKLMGSAVIKCKDKFVPFRSWKDFIVEIATWKHNLMRLENEIAAKKQEHDIMQHTITLHEQKQKDEQETDITDKQSKQAEEPARPEHSEQVYETELDLQAKVLTTPSSMDHQPPRQLESQIQMPPLTIPKLTISTKLGAPAVTTRPFYHVKPLSPNHDSAPRPSQMMYSGISTHNNVHSQWSPRIVSLPCPNQLTKAKQVFVPTVMPTLSAVHTSLPVSTPLIQPKLQYSAPTSPAALAQESSVSNPTLHCNKSPLPWQAECSHKTPPTTSRASQPSSEANSPLDLENQLKKIKLLNMQSPGSGFTFEGRSMYDESGNTTTQRKDEDKNESSFATSPFFQSLFNAPDKANDSPLQPHGERQHQFMGFNFDTTNEDTVTEHNKDNGQSALASLFGDNSTDMDNSIEPTGFFTFGPTKDNSPPEKQFSLF